MMTSGVISLKGHQKYQKALGFHSKLMAVYDFAKHKKPLVKQRFGASKKVEQNTL